MSCQLAQQIIEHVLALLAGHCCAPQLPGLRALANPAVQCVTHEAVQRLPGPAISHNPTNDSATSAGGLLPVVPFSQAYGSHS